MRAERRIEPWPLLLAALLAAGMASSLAFYALARAHPDPEVVEGAHRAPLGAGAAPSVSEADEALVFVPGAR